MPTESEYAGRFAAVSAPFWAMSARTRNDIRRVIGLAHAAIIKERNVATAEISSRWKERYAEIKLENDEWQKGLAAAFKGEMQMLYEAEDRMRDEL
jgi:hypothetical protein